MRRLGLLLVLSLAVVACDDAPVTPPETDLRSVSEPLSSDAGDYAGLSDRELLLALVHKVDALEARLERESGLARAMVDTVMNAPQWELLVSMATRPDGVPSHDPGGGGGGGFAADMETLMARTETLLVRSDSMMDALYVPGAQVDLCFDVGASLDLLGQNKLVGVAEGDGSLGAWVYGNGAFAKVKLKNEVEFAAALSVAPAFSFSVCGNPFEQRGGGPAGAAASVAPLGVPDLAELESTFNALGLNANAVSSTFRTGADVLGGGFGFTDLAALPTSNLVWMPPSLRGIADPSALKSELRDLGEQVVDRLCTDLDHLPPDIQDVVADACALTLPPLQTIVTPVDLRPLESTVRTVCNGLNGVLGESFKIPSTTLPSASISIPGVWSGTTFPGATIGGQTIHLFPQSPLNCSFASSVSTE